MKSQTSSQFVNAPMETPEGQEVYVFPASVEQHRYWLVDQLDTNSTASNMALHFHLQGQVAGEYVEQAINALLQRHEVLRTTFEVIDGEVCQVAVPELRIPLTVTDLRHLPESERRAEAHRLILAHASVCLDLAKGPLVAVHLIHVSDQEHFLAFTAHHIVCDGWSNGIILREFAELYADYAAHRVPSLPELTIQFADFSVWQHEWLQSEAAEQAREFWRKRLDPQAEVLDVATDRPRQAGKSFPGTIESHLFPESSTREFKAFCQQESITLHILLLTAFEALMYRSTGQEKFLLGSTIANRTQPSMEGVVGRFANPQVIQADVSGDPTFRELLERVRNWSVGTYAHQDLPFSQVMEQLQLSRGDVPLAQFLDVYFVYQKAFMQPHRVEGLTVTPIPSVSGGVNFDFLMAIVERAEGPRIQVEYNTDYFDQARIQRMIRHYCRILDAVILNPQLRVSELPLLSPSERSQAVLASSEAPIASPAASVRGLLEDNARRNPRAQAVESGGERLNWEGLCRRAAETAVRLRAEGVVEGSRIGLQAEPSDALLIGQLAAWYAGAAVSLIPCSLTAAETDSFLESAGLDVLLVDEAAKLRNTTYRVPAFCIRDLLQALPGTPQPPASLVEPALLGRTPSRSRSHDGVVREACALAARLDLRADDIVVLLPGDGESLPAGLALACVAAACRVVYAPRGCSAADLTRLIAESNATVVSATASEWHRVARAGWTGARHLRLAVIGDTVTPWLAGELLAQSAALHVVCPCAGTGEVIAANRITSPEEALLSLEPLTSLELTVLDGRLQPMPTGLTGSLYFRRRSSTEADWIPAGYEAMATADGRVRLVERTERLAMLNGMRLRPSEIERALLNHPSVEAASVGLVTESAAKERLVAWAKPVPAARLEPNTLAAYLRAVLPKQLVPSDFIILPAMPQTTGGAVDYAALSAPELSREKNADYAPPRDEVEARLVAIWEKVLGVTGIGVRTSFFDMGGYSLMIVRLFARINKEFGRSLPITSIFNAPTIEKLAAILRGQESYSRLVPVRPHGTKPAFFMVHSYLLYGGLPGVLDEDRPFYGLRELDSDESRPVGLVERAASYAREIVSTQPEGPYHIGGWCAAGPVALEVARQLVEAGHEVGLLALLDSWKPGFREVPAESKKSRMEVFLDVRRERFRFHRKRMAGLGGLGKLRYIGATGLHKLRNIRNKIFLRHWSAVQKLSVKYGFALPDFMHNVTFMTYASVREHKADVYPGRVTLFRASDTPLVPGSDRACGWNDRASGGVEVVWVPGDHETMFVVPNLPVLGEKMRAILQTAERNRVVNKHGHQAVPVRSSGSVVVEVEG